MNRRINRRYQTPLRPDFAHFLIEEQGLSDKQKKVVYQLRSKALASITVGAAVPDINWMYAASTTVVAGVCSILTSLAGLPEVNEDE